MGLFGKKRNMTNNAAIAIPAPLPGNTTIHNYSTNWAVIIFSGFVCLLVLFPVAWFVLVFLVEQIGFYQPEKIVAQLLFWFALILLGGWFLKWLLTDYFDKRYEFLKVKEEQITERERIKLLATQTSVDPGRMTESDFQFAQVILGCMIQAYGDNGPIMFKGRSRPWSVRNVLSVAKELKLNISQDRAGEVSKWLRKHNVVRGELEGQLNMIKFPDLGKVRNLLDKEFGKPIVASSPILLRSNEGYEIIE